MRFYLAGPMRGQPENNYPLFHAVAKKLRADGMEILNPAELNGPGTPRNECLRVDFLAILDADGVVVLPGWEASPGSSNEVALAWALNKPVYQLKWTLGDEFDGWIEAKFSFDKAPHVFELELFPLEATSVTIAREQQYYDSVPLLGLCGYAQSGKDTVAAHLVENHKFARVAFADALREMLFALNPIADVSHEMLAEYGQENYVDAIVNEIRIQDLVMHRGWDEVKTTYTEVRELLQRLGTEAGRDILGPSTWVRIGEEKIERFCPRPVVVTDVRFPNELAMVRRRNGKIIWVEREGVGPANSHASEHSITKADADIVLSNHDTVEGLWGRVDLMMLNMDVKPEPWLATDMEIAA